MTIAASGAASGGKPEGGWKMSQSVVTMDTFKWVVSGLMGALLIGAGWLLSDIRTDLRDVRKDVSALRIEASATGTRLESLLEEGRRRTVR